jgi:hypothetical protein
MQHIVRIYATDDNGIELIVSECFDDLVCCATWFCWQRVNAPGSSNINASC